MSQFSTVINYLYAYGYEQHTYLFFLSFIISLIFHFFAKSFEDHYRDDHNMYNYMYFIHHVKSKEPKDHNAIEKYVYDCVSILVIQQLVYKKCKSVLVFSLKSC